MSATLADLIGKVKRELDGHAVATEYRVWLHERENRDEEVAMDDWHASDDDLIGWAGSHEAVLAEALAYLESLNT